MLLRELFEQESKVAVLSFGRFNPTTTGHAKLVSKIESIKGDHFLFLSHTQKPKTDPLDFETKLKYAKAFFPQVVVGETNVKTPIQALAYLEAQGYTDIIFVAGSDRVDNFQQLFDTYNGIADRSGKIPFKFNSIRVVSAGDRDPDADDVAGMSASRMRAAAAADNFDEFEKGVPVKHLARALYNDVRKSMGVENVNESELLEKWLRTNINLGDGFIMLTDHWNDRQSERLDAQQLSDFKNMLTKFAADPIKSEVVALEPDSPYSKFCLYDDRNLGTAIAKRSIPLPKSEKFVITYAVTTVSPEMFPYSNQTLYKVPDQGPVRKFTDDDKKMFTQKQQQALSKTGRFEK
jgi:hypothetical protein